jgi:3'-phosphoadenosine 5'-phosphosulfate sulfotransferase (PAPS reductase)/FAD synthetase
VINKLNENYINASSHKAVKVCKPIYDWSENDVMKWLYESKIDWCEAYDRQHLTKLPLRVSTPLRAEGAKPMGKVAECSPEFYQRLIEIFPDVENQARYGKDVDRQKVLDEYLSGGLRGCVRYVRERIGDPKSQRAAMGLIKRFGELRVNNPEIYPVRDLLMHLVGGKYHRMPVPRGAESQIDGDARRELNDV